MTNENTRLAPEPGDPVRAHGHDLPLRKVPEYSASSSGAVVEILEAGTGMACPIPRFVKVNGVDVGMLTEDGVQVIAGTGMEPAVVKLTLLPRRIVVGYEDGDTPAVTA